MTRRLNALEHAGHPVVRIVMKSIDHLGQEFFRFEMATAVAGSVLGINPFNQPDVESAKIKTRELTAAFEKTGKLPAETARDVVQPRPISTPTRPTSKPCGSSAPTAASAHG